MRERERERKGKTIGLVGAWEVKLEIITESPTDQPNNRRGS